jgi:hypothetical protein
MDIVLQNLYQKSFILLSRQLWNVGLERLVLGLWGDSAEHATVTLSYAFAASSRFDLQSVSDLSLLSIGALNGLLSSESFLAPAKTRSCKSCLSIRPFFATSGGNL